MEALWSAENEAFCLFNKTWDANKKDCTLLTIMFRGFSTYKSKSYASQLHCVVSVKLNRMHIIS